MKQKSPPAQKYHFTWQRRENLRVGWMLGKELSTKPGVGGATYIISWMWPSSGSSESEFQTKNHATEFCLSTVVPSPLESWSYNQIHRCKIQWNADRHMDALTQVWLCLQSLKVRTTCVSLVLQRTWESKPIGSTNNEKSNRYQKTLCFLLSTQYWLHM